MDDGLALVLNFVRTFIRVRIRKIEDPTQESMTLVTLSSRTLRMLFYTAEQWTLTEKVRDRCGDSSGNSVWITPIGYMLSRRPVKAPEFSAITTQSPYPSVPYIHLEVDEDVKTPGCVPMFQIWFPRTPRQRA